MTRRIITGLGCGILLITASVVGAAAPEQAEAKKPQLIVCDDVRDPQSLNPYRVFSEKAHTLLQQMLEGLVRFDREGRIEPALAVSWKREGANRMRFKLRQGVEFHNGEPFDAEAVKFSLERYVDPNTKYPGYDFARTIKKVEVVDPHTVDVVTVHPDGLLLNRLAAWLHIVPPDYFQKVGGDGFAKRPIGTGPFRFEQWKRGEAIHLSAYSNYWVADRPRVQGLVFRFVPANRQVELLLKGEVDLVTELPGTMTTRVEAAPQTEIIKQYTYWTVGGTLRTAEGPLSDVRVRRALNLAIDRDDLVRYDSRGNGRILASLTSPGQSGHNPELEPYPHDPERAKRLLDEAGIERPLILKTHVRAQSERTARIIAAQLKDIGVHLDIQAIDSDAEVLRTLQSQQWDLGIAGIADPMCHSFFTQSLLLFSKSPFSLARDPGFDRRLVQMVQTLEPERRLQLARELDRYVHEQALSLFTYQKIKTYGIRAGVRFTPCVSGMPYFLDVSLDQDRDAQAGRRRPDPPEAAARTDADRPVSGVRSGP